MSPDNMHHTLLNDKTGKKQAEGGKNTFSASQSPTPAELVDALNLVFGKHTYYRPVHAKGIVLEGRFLPSPSAATLSKAPHFQNVAVPLTIRFSDFAGIPTVSDTDALASPHGLALKFHLPDGSETDLVIHSFNGFPAATTDDFRQLLIAIGSSGPGVATPTPADTYLETHPIAKYFLGSQQPPPVSFATLTYFGVNTFKFTNAEGQVSFGRYRVEPQEGNKFLPEEEIAKVAPDYLADEIRQRVARAPVRLSLRVQISEPGDKIDDPSIAWPDTRKIIELGAIEIEKVVPDSDAAERALLFLPAELPVGIEPADPMIQARNASYIVSYGRRHQ
jgi:catalase